MYDSVGLMWQVLLPPSKDRSGRERRAFPRWQAAFPVLHGNEEEFEMGAAVDLSEDGLCFVGPSGYAPDCIIHLQMQVGPTPGDWIRVRAVVRRSDPMRTAVQFLDLARADRLRLLDWYQVQLRAATANQN